MIYYFEQHIFHGNMSILYNFAIEIFIFKLICNTKSSVSLKKNIIFYTLQK